jgi:uncharacterized membrane protein YhhN
MKRILTENFKWIYGIIAIAELVFGLLPPQYGYLRYFTKPTLVLSLMLYFWQFRKNTPRSSNIFLIALFFAWLGDILLMLPDAFELGLASFLVMQVLYAWVFWHDCPLPFQGFAFRQAWIIVVVVLCQCLVLYLIIPQLNQLFLPVLIYSIAITTMVSTACNRGGQVLPKSFVWVALGAGLFMLSDGLIAFDKFGYPFPYNGFWVMLTYCAAQYLIVEGRLLQHKK